MAKLHDDIRLAQVMQPLNELQLGDAKCFSHLSNNHQENTVKPGHELEASVKNTIERICQIATNRSTTVTNTVQLDKDIGSLQSTLLKYYSNMESNEAWERAVNTSCIRLLWLFEWEPKITKKLTKVIVTVEGRQQFAGYDELSSLRDTWKLHANAGSSLLEDSSSCQKLVSENLETFLGSKFVGGKLSQLSDTLNPTVSQQNEAQLLIKVILQCFQHLPQHLNSIFQKDIGHQTITLVVSEVVNLLAYFMTTEIFGRDCSLLSGTALAFLIGLNSDVGARAALYVAIFHWIGGSSSTEIGSIILAQHKCNGNMTFARVAFLNGIMACSKEDTLSQILYSKDMKEASMASWLFHHVCQLCCGEHQYHAFQLLAQWYIKMPCANSSTLFFPSSHVVKETVSLLWTHLDSPVDGVNQSIMEVFGLLLSALQSNLATANSEKHSGTKESSQFFDFISALLKEVMHISWHVKGKHRLIAALLPYIKISKFLQDTGDLFPQLLKCMNTNYLSPSASDLYKAVVLAILSQNSKSEDVSAVFLKHCAPALITGLTSKDNSLKHNVNMLWLPWTLKTLPDISDTLLKALEQNKDNSQNIHALVSVYKCARNLQIVSIVPVEIVRQALCHPDDNLRLDAFTLICITNKKSEALQPWEMETLEEFLPYNLNIDSAPFRQQLQTCLRNVLVRGRDSSLAYLRADKTLMNSHSTNNWPANLLQTLRFVQCVWDMCVGSLHLGSSFQRLKTSLDWMTVVLDSFTYQPLRSQKKGTTPQAVNQLKSLGQKFGMLDFCNSESSHAVLACIYHGTDEIREMSGDMLLQYFPWPLPVAECEMSVARLCCTGLTMCHSAKPYESEGGALIAKLIFDKYVLLHGYRFQFEVTENGIVSKVEGLCDVENATVVFISEMLKLLVGCVQCARKNVLTAAQTQPAHGVVLAIRRCISECSVDLTSDSEWQMLISELLRLTTELLELGLSVLGGRLHDDVTAPSFEQMGISIQAAVSESLGEENDEDSCVLSNNYQIISTWCWINIKECSMLYCHLVEKLHDCNKQILDIQQIRKFGDIFYKILTQCRHRGAIEGCNTGFTRYCTKLLFSPVQELCLIPSEMLDRVMEQVRSSGSAASITRRSAGLPLIVLSVVTAESKTKQTGLLRHAIETLLSVVSSPVTNQQDENRDLPQVHAINILKAVFRESSVAMASMQFLAPAAIATIQGFSSQFWAIRNGAIQLYGTLLQRMLGQKKTRDDRLTTQTVQEFFTHFPSLQAFLLEEMSKAGIQHQKQDQPSLQLHPSLFPILSILVKLSNGPQTLSHRLGELMVVVRSLGSSPILAVREMAAQALVPLVPRNKVSLILANIINTIPCRKEGHARFNDIHGSLLQADRLLTSHELREEQLGSTWDALSKRCWLLNHRDNACAVVRSAYMKTLITAMSLSDCQLSLQMKDHIKEEVKVLLAEKDNSHFQVGQDQHTKIIIELWLRSSDEESLVNRLNSCLKCQDVEVHLGVLGYLRNALTMECCCSLKWEDIMEMLTKLVCKGRLPWQVLCESLQLMLDLCHDRKVPLHDSDGQVLACLLTMVQREVNSKPAALALALSAAVIKEKITKGSWTGLEEWTKLLAECCDPIRCDSLRFDTALALTTVIKPIWTTALCNKQPCILWNVYYTTCKLLLDDQAFIRCQAAQAASVCLIDEHEGPPLHPNLALQKFIRKAMEEFQSLEAEFIFKKLLDCDVDLSAAMQQDCNKIVEDLFEPEDVNPYMENHVIDDLIKTSFEESSCLTLPGGVLAERVKKVTQELCSAHIVLTGSCKGPLNITCMKKTCEGLRQYLHVLEIMITACPENKFCQTVKSNLLSYKSLPYLHPFLKFKVKNILNICDSHM